MVYYLYNISLERVRHKKIKIIHTPQIKDSSTNVLNIEYRELYAWVNERERRQRNVTEHCPELTFNILFNGKIVKG